MRTVKLLTLPLAALLALVSCKSQYETLLAGNDVDAKYKAAFNYFNSGKYQKAASLFESMAILTNGTERSDTVQYYWGLSNYRFKDYYTAETNFSKFVESYPGSPFAPEARFLRIDCMYRSTLRYELDQAPTYNTINAIKEYLMDYGGNEHYSDCNAMLNDLNDRLDTKAYEGARLYFKMEDYKAAKVAFKNVLKTNADNIYREDILYYIAKSSYKYAQLSVPSKQKERYMTFIDDYLNFVGEIPDSPYRRELNALYARAQRALGNTVGANADLETGDKVFEKERKAAGAVKKVNDDSGKAGKK